MVTMTETRAPYQDGYRELDEGTDRDGLRALKGLLKAHRTLALVVLNNREPSETGRAYTNRATVMGQIAYSIDRLPAIPRQAIKLAYMHPYGAVVDRDRHRDWRTEVYQQVADHYGVTADYVGKLTNQALGDVLRSLRTAHLNESAE